MIYYKNMKKVLVIIMLSLVSCDIQKQAAKSKSDTEYSEQIETVLKRKGDTVTYIVPVIKHKDTTIYTVNRQGTTLRTVYDQTGNIASIDCFASVIEEIRKENREFQQSIKEKEKEKTEEFDGSFILYIVAGVVVLGIVFMFFLFKSINNNSKVLATLVEKFK